MKCDCGGRARTLETREKIDSVGVIYVRRRLECIECGKKYSTIEGNADFIDRLLKINKVLTREGLIK